MPGGRRRDLPALEGLPSAGQIRLQAVTVDAVASAVETLADATSNSAYRQAIASLGFRPGNEFARDVEEWIGSAFDDAEPH